MPKGGPLPALWLLSDARNDAVLETVLRRLPRGSGFIFRHYHLDTDARRQRFDQLRRIARRFGHQVVLSGNVELARRWGADGTYGSTHRLRGVRGLLRITTAHDLREIGMANRLGADAIMLSPVFPTRSHPGAPTLGPLRFRLLAQHATMPVIALGGMDASRAKRLKWRRWSAIDGLSTGHLPPDS